MNRQAKNQPHAANAACACDYGLPLRTAADPGSRQNVTLYEALAAKGMTVGTIVQSMAGHDYGRLAIIVSIRPPFARIVDGKYRPAARPKQKRLTHLRPVAQGNPEALAIALDQPDEGQRNSAIRKLIDTHLTDLGTQAPQAPEKAPSQNP